MPGAAQMSNLQALIRLSRAAPVAVGAAVAAALVAAAGIAVALEGSVSVSPADRLFEIALGLACATCAALGALIIAAIPRQRVGIALVVGGTLGLSGRWRRRWPRAIAPRASCSSGPAGSRTGAS